MTSTLLECAGWHYCASASAPAGILNRLFTLRLKNSPPRAQGRAVWIPPVNDLKLVRSLSVQRTEVGMTSDTTWQGRGARPQPLQAAREAARRSGMSVGEWLDSVIQESARPESARPESTPPPPPLS